MAKTKDTKGTLYITGNPAFPLADGTLSEVGVFDPSKVSKDADIEFMKRTGALSTKKPLALLELEADEEETEESGEVVI